MIEGQRPKEPNQRVLRIGIDIDDVVSDHFKNVVSGFNTKFGTSFTLEDISSFYFLESVNVGAKEERLRLLRQLYSDMGTLFDYAQPIDRSVEIVRQLTSDAHEVHFISSRQVDILGRTVKWLTENGFPATEMNVHLRKSQNQDAVQFKVQKSKDLGLNVVIEDDSRVAALLDITVILLDYAWNRDIDSQDVLRASSWEEIYLHIQRLSNEV